MNICKIIIYFVKLGVGGRTVKEIVVFTKFSNRHTISSRKGLFCVLADIIISDNAKLI